MNNKLKIDKKPPSYLKRSSEGGLLIGFIYVLTFLSILFLIIWQTFESESNKASEQLINERLLLIEDQLSIVDETNNDSLTDISSSIQFLDKEIRKLWDLSNKRNKQRIATLEDQLNSIDSSIKEIFTQSQEIRLISKEFSKSISDIKTRVAKIDTSSLSSPDYELRIKDLEEAVNSMDSFRRQTNQSILKLKDELSKSISNQENSESNSLPIEN